MASTSSTLKALALVAEHLLGLLAVPDLLGEGPVARDDLAHLLLDRGKIFRRERLVAEEVVIEAVLDHRADRHLRARPQRLHRFRQHVRGVVADQFQRARIVAGDELDLRILRDRIGEVGELAVERHRHGALGERRRDALGDVEAGDVLGKFPPGAVGEGQGDLLHGFGGFQIAEAVMESGLGFVGRLTSSSPCAHSCERAQVSGKQRYSRRFGRCNRGVSRKLGNRPTSAELSMRMAFSDRRGDREVPQEKITSTGCRRMDLAPPAC